MRVLEWLSELGYRLRTSSGKTGKVLFVLMLIVAVILGLAVSFVWMLGKLFGALRVGRVQNLDLYLPQRRR